MSTRVAFKATLVAVAFLIVLVAGSAWTLSADRNAELTAGMEFACRMAAMQLETVEPAERENLLAALSTDLEMRVGYYNGEGTAIFDEAGTSQPISDADAAQATIGAVRAYTGRNADGEASLFVIYQFQDNSYLRMSRDAISAFGVFSERPLGYMLLLLGMALIVFFTVLIVDSRRSNTVRQIIDVLEQFSEGVYDARVAPQKGDSKALVNEYNAMIERIQERVFRQRSRDYALNVVMNQMQNGILVVDDQLKLLLATPVARKLLGIAPKSEGKPISEASKDVSLDALFVDAMQQDGVYTNEVAAKTAVGRGHRPLRLYVSPMRQDGKVVGALAMIEDITELRRLEQVRTDFVANVSHELKTPLTSIKGFVETLLDGAMNNPEMATKFLKIIMLEAERLTRLINDILSISKLESGMNEVATERLRLDKMAYDVADMLRIHAGEKNVQINAHMNKKPVYIIGNADQVEQMLINLTENAIKYNKPGGSVTVHVFGNDNEANLCISDTGIGIAEEHLPRMFERFYRVDKGRSRSMGGTGLGLAIVKHIVKALNGEIEVHSKLGEGTEFLVTIPIAPPPTEAESDELSDGQA